VERAVLQTTPARYRTDGSWRFVAIGTGTYRIAMVVLTLIDLVDAAAFILGEYCGMFESVYGEIEWAVLSIFAQPIYVILTKKSSLNLRACSNDGR